MRRASVLVLVAAMALPTACAGSSKQSKSDDVCGDFEVQVERYWSASIRAQALDHGGAIEVERRTGVVNDMDRISEDWVMMRTSACRDHFVRGLIDQAEYAARVRCFDDRLERQRTLATALAGDAELDAIEAALGELLAQPASCTTDSNQG